MDDMEKLIKSQDGYTWMNVTDKAHDVFMTGLFNLQALWVQEGDNQIQRSPIESIGELNIALETGKAVCIFIGQDSESIRLGFVTQDSWSAAEKITHEGFTYVRFKDLVFCK